MAVVLKVITENKVLKYPLTEKPFSIGRSRSADCVIREELASRIHAEFYLGKDAKAYVKDLDSTNGTKINGNILKGEMRLQIGDIIRIGSVDIRLSTSAMTPEELILHRGEYRPEMTLSHKALEVHDPRLKGPAKGKR